MRIIKIFVFVWTLIGMVLASVEVFAQPEPSQTAGGVIKRESDFQQQDNYGRRIQRWPSKEKEEAPAAEEERSEMTSAAKVVVREVKVEGAELISQEDIDQTLASQFTPGEEMTFNQMQRLAGEITALYRQKGFVTSRAYLPPQSLDGGVLFIKVIEGRMGQYTISGNKYFTTEQLNKKFTLKSGAAFDYSDLQRSLEYINEHPDRQARVVLVPGEEPGTTDVDVKIQDQPPVHATLEYDNWASRYLNKDRYAVTLEHNNLTKHDDRLSIKFLTSEGNNLLLAQGRYIYPLSNTLEVGAQFLTSKTELGREFEVLEAHGSADVIGVFATQELVNTIDFNLNLNLGFDHKNVKNYLLGVESSSDRVRVARIGFDADYDDRWGRSIANLEWDFGIPGIFEGMEDHNDPSASRAGAGGEFNKGIFNFFRLQPLPSSWKYLNETYFLWKNLAQYSDDVLVASEQFQIGGPTSVRGYAPGEASGDSGIYSALEWSLPFYGLSREAKIPGREETWYDSLKWVLFYDWGWVDFENPQPGERNQETLRGYGAGVRLNIARDIAVRIEVGWPDGRKSEDSRRAHTWVEVDWKF